jgi:hypothetical protein
MRVPAAVATTLILVEEGRIEVRLVAAKTSGGPCDKTLAKGPLQVSNAEGGSGQVTVMRKCFPTHSAHHAHVASHAHHPTTHAHHVAGHRHGHTTHVAAHSHTTASAATIDHTATHATHHATAVETTGEVIHSTHATSAEVVHGGSGAEASSHVATHITTHVTASRARKVAVWETHVILVSSVVEVASVIVVVEAIEASAAAALVAAVVASWCSPTLLPGWDIFWQCFKRVDVGRVEGGGWPFRLCLALKKGFELSLERRGSLGRLEMYVDLAILIVS